MVDGIEEPAIELVTCTDSSKWSEQILHGEGLDRGMCGERGGDSTRERLGSKKLKYEERKGVGPESQ